MGQYYTVVLRRPSTKNYIIGNPGHFGYGPKLWENGCIDSVFTKVVYAMLREHTMNVAWVGDYAETQDLLVFGTPEDKVEPFIEQEKRDGNKLVVDGDINYNQIERFYNGSLFMGHFFGDAIVINHTKREFFDQEVYLKRANVEDIWKQIDPLVVLTAIGNGKGGGDYMGKNANWAGRWATDAIKVKSKSEVDLDELKKDGYEEIFPDFIEEDEEKEEQEIHRLSLGESVNCLAVEDKWTCVYNTGDEDDVDTYFVSTFDTEKEARDFAKEKIKEICDVYGYKCVTIFNPEMEEVEVLHAPKKE